MGQLKIEIAGIGVIRFSDMTACVLNVVIHPALSLEPRQA